MRANMERLKVVIADKILETSSGGAEQMNDKLFKIQRFTDFAEACKSLMLTYPEIEPALIRMVNEYDFDTVKASRTVDAISIAIIILPFIQKYILCTKNSNFRNTHYRRIQKT